MNPPSKTPTGKLVLIIGPSGVGKSVVLKALHKRCPELHVPRSATTRTRRPGEGEDLYRFVTAEEFDVLIEQGKVLEWARVHEGDRYGTLVEEIIPFIQKGNIVVREVDVQGFDSIRKHKLFEGENAPYELQSIFILPESKEQLTKHIKERAPIAAEELQRRLASIEEEMSYADLCDARVKNVEGKLDDTVRHVEMLIA